MGFWVFVCNLFADTITNFEVGIFSTFEGGNYAYASTVKSVMLKCRTCSTSWRNPIPAHKTITQNIAKIKPIEQTQVNKNRRL